MAENSDKVSNEAGSTKTTGQEYVKRESGEQNVPAETAKNLGETAATKEDLEHPKQDAQRPHPADEAVADQIKETNK